MTSLRDHRRPGHRNHDKNNNDSRFHCQASEVVVLYAWHRHLHRSQSGRWVLAAVSVSGPGPDRVNARKKPDASRECIGAWRARSAEGFQVIACCVLGVLPCVPFAAFGSFLGVAAVLRAAKQVRAADSCRLRCVPRGFQRRIHASGGKSNPSTPSLASARRTARCRACSGGCPEIKASINPALKASPAPTASMIVRSGLGAR